MSARKYLRDVYPNAHDFDCRCAPHVSWGEFDGVTQQRDKARRALAESEKRVRVLEALDGPFRWLGEHYPKAFREMPTEYIRAFDTARAALLEGEPDAR